LWCPNLGRLRHGGAYKTNRTRFQWYKRR
jgi:hypothetical protein